MYNIKGIFMLCKEIFCRVQYPNYFLIVVFGNFVLINVKI